MVAQAVEKGVVTAEEADLLRRAEEARTDVIQVDSFTLEEYMRTSVKPDVAGDTGGDGAEAPAAALPSEQ